MDSGILGWIKAALAAAKSTAAPLALRDAAAIVKAAKGKFVRNNPRAWWMKLKGEPKLYDSHKYTVGEILPTRDNRYWFIPETEENELKVFDLTFSEIDRLLQECPFFEFYIVDKEYRWLIAESDHNQFHVLDTRRLSEPKAK